MTDHDIQGTEAATPATGEFLVTGAAGFVGFHVAERLLKNGARVVGLDNINSYYDVSLKHARLDRLRRFPSFEFEKAELAQATAVDDICGRRRWDAVIHLAAQAGVRWSIENPRAYIDSNIVGFFNVVEACRRHGIAHLVYASSSSVYGASTKTPFAVGDNVDHPVSLYAATKIADEAMAEAYSVLYGIPMTGLRFFTVYGPWGRPDMAYFKFTKAIVDGTPIDVYHNGNLERDFTYIDDVVEAIVRLVRLPPKSHRSDRSAIPSRHAIYNIGNHTPVKLTDFISTLERVIGRHATRRMLPMQPGDVPATFADVEALGRAVGFRPRTELEDGLRRFYLWYREFYAVS